MATIEECNNGNIIVREFAMDPVSIAGLVGGLAGLFSGGACGVTLGMKVERAARVAQAQRVHDLAVIEDLRQRVATGAVANAAGADNSRRTLTAEEFSDYTLFMRDTSTSADGEDIDRVRTQVNMAIVETLAQQSPSQNELNRCLLWAIRFGASPGFIEHIEALLVRGANVNYTENGYRPISVAIYFCIVEVVQKLIAQNGIDLQARIKGKTVLEYAKIRCKYLNEAVAATSGLAGQDFMAALHLYQTASVDIIEMIDEVVNPVQEVVLPLPAV